MLNSLKTNSTHVDFENYEDDGLYDDDGDDQVAAEVGGMIWSWWQIA